MWPTAAAAAVCVALLQVQNVEPMSDKNFMALYKMLQKVKCPNTACHCVDDDDDDESSSGSDRVCCKVNGTDMWAGQNGRMHVATNLFN